LDQISDEILLKQYANGDFAAFEQLYARTKGGLFRYLLRQVHNKALVEDIFQEVWGKVISHAASFQETASFKTWLYTIARNKVIDHVRHLQVADQIITSPKPHADESRADDMSEHYSSATNAPETLHKRLLDAQAIEHCLEKLPKHQLDCFLLREEAGLSAVAIADVMAVSMEATKSRIKTSYKNLRACLSLKLGLEIKTKLSGNTSIDEGVINE
jgi:RNA polymerase sigma-70 factor (ECF subfamily)